MDEISLTCSDTESYMNQPSEHFQDEHEHTLSEIQQEIQKDIPGNGWDQAHIDADHLMGALALLLAQRIDDPAITEQVTSIVKSYRKSCDDWWYS